MVRAHSRSSFVERGDEPSWLRYSGSLIATIILVGLTRPTSQTGLIRRGGRMKARASVSPQPGDLLAPRASVTSRLSALNEYWLPTLVLGHV